MLERVILGSMSHTATTMAGKNKQKKQYKVCESVLSMIKVFKDYKVSFILKLYCITGEELVLHQHNALKRNDKFRHSQYLYDNVLIRITSNRKLITSLHSPGESIPLQFRWVGAARFLKPLTYFRSKCHFRYPISDLTQTSIPFFRPLILIHVSDTRPQLTRNSLRANA